MGIKICGAPGCWGVEAMENPNTPSWHRVLHEAHLAGYTAIELGPTGWIPMDDVKTVIAELEKNQLAIVAGTIFSDLVDDENYPKVLDQVDMICNMLNQLPKLPVEPGQKVPAPYMTVMDWGHDDRDYGAGHYDRAPRLNEAEWAHMMEHVRGVCERAMSHGIRPVIHPHAGGYMEFEDEIAQVARDIPASVAGFCMDTGHLAYSGMDPAAILRQYQDRIEYVHFKDINKAVYDQVMGEHIRFFEGCAKGSMCPIGRGMLDYKGIAQALEDIKYNGYITIEQERDPANCDGTLEDVKASVDFLKSIGYKI